MEIGMIRWEWEGNGNKKVIPAHLYSLPSYTWRSACISSEPVIKSRSLLQAKQLPSAVTTFARSRSVVKRTGKQRNGTVVALNMIPSISRPEPLIGRPSRSGSHRSDSSRHVGLVRNLLHAVRNVPCTT